MNILVLNAGSSTLKFGLFEMQSETCIARGLKEEVDLSPHTFRCLFETDIGRHRIDAVAHRVVHGGRQFSQATLVDNEVLAEIERTIPLAPLHNPANLTGIRQAMLQFPNTPQVAIFDTAFHQTLPEHAYRYALSETFCADHDIRRYGFHGIAHHFLATESASFLNRSLEELNLITLHLGSGASACAIRNGCSIDTSMGMTPMEGLIMGSRCGDLDPGIALKLLDDGMSPDAIRNELNNNSGLKGLCNTQDMREILALADNNANEAQMALRMYCYRIQKYIGAYTAVLGRVDALVFSGGIGEHSNTIRSMVCQPLRHFNFAIAEERNRHTEKSVSSIQEDGFTPILVIKANEELDIARQTYQMLFASR